MNIKSKNKFVKRVSLLMTLSFIVSNFTFRPIKTLAANATNTAYAVDSSNYDKPQPHLEQSILADVYKNTPGYQPSDRNIPKGWQFFETELFPVSFFYGTDRQYNRYHGSPTAQSYMDNAHYSYDTSNNVEASNYYDNWRFPKIDNVPNQYNYGPLIYYQQLPVNSQSPVKILGDTCNVEYQIDTRTFDQGPNNGTTAYNKMPDYTSLNAGDEYVADYHISGVTANPVAIAPTADFYFNSGSTSATVGAGDTLEVIDGTTSSTYDNTSTKYWSTYYDISGNINKHNNNSALPQSYTYNNAIIKHAGWSVTNSSGQNVNDLFNASNGLKNKSTTGAASEMDLTISDSVPAGTYTVHHTVADNWGSTSGEQTRTFTVSDIKQHYLTVHYMDEDSGTDIQDLDKQTSPYTPQAPSGYTLTGNYRTNPTGNDSIFNYNNGTEISVDLSTSDKEIYVMCKKSEGKGTVVKRYFLDDIEQKTDEQEIKDVPVGSQTYNVDKTYDGYTCTNPTVTVNVIANDTVYADFKFTSNSIPPPTSEKGTVIKRYFVDGAEQTADESEIDNVDVGPHTYGPDKSYPRHTCANSTVTVNVIANSTVYADFNFGLVNHPPTVTLQAPSEVVMGDDVNVNASGVDPDADPLTYTWNTPPDLKGSASGYTASGYFENTGDKTYSVTVTDPYDASGSASKTVKVIPPVPNVVIDKSGNEKENRKVTLNAEKYSSSGSNSGRYPLDWSKAKWQFFDGSGNELTVDSDPTSSTIVKSLQSTTGAKNMDLIFKKAGKYTAKCTLYNTAGYSNSFSVDLNIVLDLAPTADFNFPDGNNGYRDGKDLSPNGLAQGTDKLVDSSSSRDNDNIGKRMWLACFDSDNDGSFIDITNNEDGTKKAVPEKERWYVYDLDYNGDSDARYKIQVPDSTPLNGNLVTIGSDGHKYAYINDSLNPHWRYVGSYDDVKKLDINKINCGNLTSVNFKSTSCGHFYYAEEVEESFGQETIPELITDKDKKQANTFEF